MTIKMRKECINKDTNHGNKRGYRQATKSGSISDIRHSYAGLLYRITALIIAVCLFIVSTNILGVVTAVKAAGEDDVRYSVLVLDYADAVDFYYYGEHFYTAGTPIKYVREAAQAFISDIREAKGKNYVAVVVYAENAMVAAEFTDNFDYLSNEIINNLDDPWNSQRCIKSGLEMANELLNEVTDKRARKNIVLLSTGMSNGGDYDYEGFYSDFTLASFWENMSTGIKLYAYSNAAYETAKEIDKAGINIYSIGVFQTMEDIPKDGAEVVEFFKMAAFDLASSPGNFYAAENPEELEFLFGEVADSISQGKMKGTFSYLSGDKDYDATFYFDTDYFAEGASNYNASLATMSLCLAMSAFGSYTNGGYKYQYMNAYNLLDTIGFSDIEVNEYYQEKPQQDTMGVIVGQREITVNDKQYTLLAVATRGAGYESEWAGNFTLGESGDHDGFNRAATEVETFLKGYISRHRELADKEVKLWITGYSRAAATANLVAGHITKKHGIDALSLEKENIYAYCFEPPMGVNNGTDSEAVRKSMTNIHNIINKDDLVPRVAMSVWGFSRYGTDEFVIPVITTISDKSAYDKMLVQLKGLRDSDNPAAAESLFEDPEDKEEKHVLENYQAKHINYKLWSVKMPTLRGHWERVQIGWFSYYDYFVEVDDWGSIDFELIQDSDKSMSAFQDDLIKELCIGFKSRANFSQTVEPAVRAVAADIFGNDSKKLNDALTIFLNKLSDNIYRIYKTWYWSGTDEVGQLIAGLLTLSFDEAGIEIEDGATAGEAATEAIDSIVRAIIAALWTNGGDDLATLFANGKYIFTSHYPELIFAWMMSLDKNYTGEDGEAFTPVTRIIHINCPVDVYVYDSDGNLVAQIEDDIPIEIEDSLISAYYTADGEKQICLPADGSYKVLISATDEGTLSYSVDEYSYELNDHVKTVNYYDIPISKGDVFWGDVTSCNSDEVGDISEGLNIEYPLYYSDNKLEPDIILTTAETKSLTAYVTVENNNEKGGVVAGSGIRTIGNFAQVYASPYANCTFDGWYVNGKKISEEENYRFRVEEDIILEARFSGMAYTPENGAVEINFEIEGEGSITRGSEGWYVPGSELELTAQPDYGYEFSHWKTESSGYFDDPCDSNAVFHPGSVDTIITAVFVPEDEYCPHTNISGGRITENTCTEKGSISKISCKDCGQTLQDAIVIPAKGHRFLNGICVDCGYNEKTGVKSASSDSLKEYLQKIAIVAVAIAVVVLLLGMGIAAAVISKQRNKGK